MKRFCSLESLKGKRAFGSCQAAQTAKKQNSSFTGKKKKKKKTLHGALSKTRFLHVTRMLLLFACYMHCTRLTHVQHTFCPHCNMHVVSTCTTHDYNIHVTGMFRQTCMLELVTCTGFHIGWLLLISALLKWNQGRLLFDDGFINFGAIPPRAFYKNSNMNDCMVYECTSSNQYTV